MKEIWKDIKEFEGFYQISNLGKVRSLDRKVYANINNNEFVNKKGKILKSYIGKIGYYVVNLSKNGKRRLLYIHRLVADAFIPKIEGKNFVNHINADKENNNINNLEWCTNKENINHALKNGYHNHNYKKVKVAQYDLDNNFIRTWDSIKEASETLKIAKGNISAVCCGVKKQAGGYLWKK